MSEAEYRGKDSQIQEKELKNDIIEGRNAVIEALRAGRAIDKIFIAKGDVDKTLATSPPRRGTRA